MPASPPQYSFLGQLLLLLLGQLLLRAPAPHCSFLTELLLFFTALPYQSYCSLQLFKFQLRTPARCSAISELLLHIDLSSKTSCNVQPFSLLLFCSRFFYPHCLFFLWFPLLTAFPLSEIAPHSSVLWFRVLRTFARCMHLFANSSSYFAFACSAPVSQSTCFSELLGDFGDSLLLIEFMILSF